MPTLEKYVYAATILEVYDGDTVTALVQLGFNITQTMKLRLARINAPELREPEKLEGLAARDWLRERILNKAVTLKTFKDRQEKYGRYLADVYLSVDAPVTPVCINDELVNLGLADYKDY